MEAVVNKLGGMDGVERFLRGALTVSAPPPSWREQDGVIYFTLPPTDGTTGPAWIARLEKKGFRLSKWAKDVLLSREFKPTTGVTSEIAVLKGMLFEDKDRITQNICDLAIDRKLITPNAEIACLIREMFSDNDIEAMGLWWIVAMHEPIKDSDGGPSFLNANRSGGDSWLNTYCDDPGYRWTRVNGFAFLVSQVSA